MPCEKKELEEAMTGDQRYTPGTTRDEEVCGQRFKESFPNPLTVVFLVWGVMFALAGLCLALIH